MNKFILKHGTLVTFAILSIFAWFIYRAFIMGSGNLIPFIAVVIIFWMIGTVVFICFWPPITYTAYKRAVLQHGLGGSPIPVNTLYAVPNRASPSASSGSLLATGTNEVLYIGGWLDLSKGPLVLHVPDFSERYYSVQFTDPSTGTDFAYVGTRTTGTQAGDFVITGPGWKGSVPLGMLQIFSLNRSVMVVGRTHVESDSDVAAAYDLSKQVQLTPLSHWQPSP